MAGPARDDGGVKLYTAAAAGALLTGLVLTGCASGSPAGPAQAAGTAEPSASASVSPASGSPMSSGPPSSPNDQNGTATPVAGAGPAGTGCAAWPAGSKPPRLIGTALAPAPARPGGAIQSPAATYSAVRAGVARLIVVRLPCRSAQTPRTPLASPAAGTMAYISHSGGAPVGAQCQLVEALQVTIVVS